ncbi:MAG: hypothetical protein LBT40_11165 [Deltaproteobacteria bacterium]|nr:hypothetical protein [Deltaproteobacteria bacterium]
MGKRGSGCRAGAPARAAETMPGHGCGGQGPGGGVKGNAAGFRRTLPASGGPADMAEASRLPERPGLLAGGPPPGGGP